MGFEGRPKRPAEVEKAIKAGDKEKIIALASAGGIASAKRRAERDIHAELDREMHEKSMHQTAKARHDELLPKED